NYLKGHKQCTIMLNNHEPSINVLTGGSLWFSGLSFHSYKMDASHCGLCLIINNVKFLPESYLRSRNGSNIDCDKLEKRFKSLNFIVDVQQDLTHEVTLSKKDHTKYDCCIVVILSHGSKNLIPGAVHGVDGPTVPVEDITSFLNGEHCPSLQGKPKIFFIQPAITRASSKSVAPCS
uniref:Caspase family p20 domain-containing protein n=1 Tax=Paramormyrops kingsleyae TaxID=1676925 RepID=A0A3B3S5Q7_9TELE